MIVLGLGRFDTEKTRSLLVNLLTDDDVRAHAAAALGRLGAREASPMLTRLLTDKDYLTRKEAKIALGKIQKKESRSSKRRRP
jgi:HEAT repeat protein